MKGLMFLLLAVKETAKELHYTFIKDFALHKLYDEVEEGIDELRDDLAEIGIIGAGDKVPSAKEELNGCLKALEEVETSREGLRRLCEETLDYMKDIETDQGGKTVLDNIAAKLNKCIALL